MSVIPPKGFANFTEKALGFGVFLQPQRPAQRKNGAEPIFGKVSAANQKLAARSFFRCC